MRRKPESVDKLPRRQACRVESAAPLAHAPAPSPRPVASAAEAGRKHPRMRASRVRRPARIPRKLAMSHHGDVAVRDVRQLVSQQTASSSGSSRRRRMPVVRRRRRASGRDRSRTRSACRRPRSPPGAWHVGHRAQPVDNGEAEAPARGDDLPLIESTRSVRS